MATIFKRKGSPCWQISYFHEGTRITKSLGTSDKTIANAEKKKLEGNLAGQTHQEFGKVSLSAVFDLYKASKVERKARTNKGEFQIIDNFIKAVDKRMDAITDNDIVDYLERYRSRSPVTYKNIGTAIKRFFAFAVKKKKIAIQRNPASDIEFRRIIKKTPIFFSDEEYLRIEKAAAGSPLLPMIAVARYTGLRLAELRHLEWEDFDWPRQEVQVRNKPQYGHTIKTYQERRAPISGQLIYKLLPYRKENGLCFPAPGGGVYSFQGPKRVMDRILKDAGIKFKKDGVQKGKGEGFKTLRKTFASRLVQNGADITLVSKWMGHSSIAVTEGHYAAFRPKYHADIERLNIPDTADKIADNDFSKDSDFGVCREENWCARQESNLRPTD